MKAEPRVAFFTDSYLEVNGIANTSRRLTEYARNGGHRLLCVHAGPETGVIDEGSLRRLSLKRTGIGFRLDADLSFDILMTRHLGRATDEVVEFGADLVHITGPSDIGLLGALVAWRLGLPLVISWHTNIHEYAGRRLAQAFQLPDGTVSTGLTKAVEKLSLAAILWFYRRGRVLMAPNEELASMLETGCRRPVFMMRRGVDTSLFSPDKRTRRAGPFVIGYVGRLTPEKNVRSLANLEWALIELGMTDFKFVITGTGSEEGWLKKNLLNAEFTGVLRGEELATAYADMDIFVFPSQTDTFGNVVLEAQASGLPAVVTKQGGPRFIILNGLTGYAAADEYEMAQAIISSRSQPEVFERMRIAARQNACTASWKSIFDHVWMAYQYCLQERGFESTSLAAAQFVKSDAIR